MDECATGSLAYVWGDGIGKVGWVKCVLKWATSGTLQLSLPRNRDYEYSTFAGTAPIICTGTRRLRINQGDDPEIQVYFFVR